MADSADILHWSDLVTSDYEFSRLVRRLIQANNDQVVRLGMRAAEGARVPGWDGEVEAVRSTAFVPEGKSYWELGTGVGPQTKANSDYCKRTNALGEGRNCDATFVFVTSRRWADKGTWEAEKRAEGRWRDVRAFDVDDLEQTMEAAPAVHVWFSEMVGKPARGAQSLEDWWGTFAVRTNPQLTPALALAGREDNAAELIRFLDQDRSFTTISAPSVEDALAFMAATMLSSEEEFQSKLSGGTLFVRDAYYLRRLDGVSHLVLVVPPDDTLRREAESVRGHHIVFLAEEDSPADIKPSAIAPRAFTRQLTELGVAEHEAERLAQAAHRSLRRYQRMASPEGSIRVQEWTAQLRSRIVRRGWLAGGWNTSRPGDANILSALFGEDYSEAIEELRHCAKGADPLFTYHGDKWSVAAPDDSWEYARPQIVSSDLQALEIAIQSVFGEVDPALELPVQDRWMAAVYGKERLHSTNLRKGLATTLALLGANGETLSLESGSTGRSRVEGIVYRLLNRANQDSTGQLWSSLSDVLPLLAEAAPDVFLGAVQAGLEGDDPLLRTLFLDQYDGFSVHSPHTGLLWALETVAWSKSHFGFAVELLARLSEVDPGGRLLNRPISSLVEIFCPWMPQTAANAASRIAALKALLGRHPEIGWNMLFALLPERHGAWQFTHAPRFRRWKPSTEGVIPQEFWEFSSTVAELILDLTKLEPRRWTEVAPRLDDFPAPQRRQAYAELEELSDQAIPEDIRKEIWQALDEELRKHREFPDAVWVLPSDELDRLAKAIEPLRPASPVERNLWLFDDSFPDIGASKREDHEAYEAELARLRQDAVTDILMDEGLTGVQRLATLSSLSWLVGVTLADTKCQIDAASIVELLDSEDQTQVDLAFAYVSRTSQGKLDWLLPFAERMSDRPLTQARILGASEEHEKAWAAAKQLGPEVDAAYWRRFRTNILGAAYALVNDTARQLVEHGRPAAALHLLSRYRKQEIDPVNPQVVVAAFEALLTAQDEEAQALKDYEIEKLLEFLRYSQIDEDTLAFLEWRLLPALRFDASSPVLERRLSRDPAFFVELISLSFIPKSREVERQIPTAVVKNAYRLIRDWTQVPGSEKPGSQIDAVLLRAWLVDTRRLLIEADRKAIGETYVGNVFAHAPIDEDGTWPPLVIRNIIEESASTELEDGFQMGATNKRGVTTRGLEQGGEQEYRLAEQYRSWADVVADQWPRTAAVLRSLADKYRAEGRTHDDEAIQFKVGLRS